MKPLHLTTSAKTPMAREASDYINSLANANGFTTASTKSYAGNFVSGAEFADSMAYELGYIPKDLPSWIATHIDWQAVWDAELSHDYFAHNDHYFRNM